MSEAMKNQDLFDEGWSAPKAEYKPGDTADCGDDVEAVVNGAVHERVAGAEDSRRRKSRTRAVGATLVFGAAGALMLGGMAWGMVDQLFAIPFAIIYFSRAAVRADRHMRRWGQR